MRLLAELTDDPWSGLSPSVYETGRLVALAPWLTGHEARVRYLLDTQHADGTWGGPGEYALVPTLSVVDALQDHPAARRGLQALRTLLTRPLKLPDTVAVELIVPALAERLGLRTPLDPRPLHALRQRPLPEKLWHTLEIFGPRPEVTAVDGIVAASPAATAVQLGGPRPGRSLDYLEAVQRRHGGPVPAGVPVPLFERSWIIVALKSAGLDVPDAMTDQIRAAFTRHGAAGGPGLPADADDTATALHALALCDSPRPTETLARYREARHFACFPNERTPSTSTNAHALQAIGHDRQLEEWLRDMQERGGYWLDKWHASPYYATACVTNALRGNDKAVDWVLSTQNADGSWGRWEGTYEETAYAIRILSHSRADVSRAITRGAKFMQEWGNRPHPPLWHDKDLYTPTRIVRAEGLAALHLACAVCR
ncbi:prenyltransferase/squalene oxidase repeat-containing protein [Lentzea aerocolonigenes]|uniref:prenyltransferase/squalene oxidase repeat-containing protein n=1 Tax=Lentzea aerocolonigenes TaxID=68170 RepID=UPI00068FD8E3|nr:prenyltransferase/squalene oxidase repeat-containing protein [Lentzea aerocolonigenes]MCP2247395.1 Prenyltransferase and squalene oxidase repeat-containing protein [Lentzea aerocolonigenes]